MSGPQISFSAHYSTPFRDDVLCALRKLVDLGSSHHSPAEITPVSADEPALKKVVRAGTPPTAPTRHEPEVSMGTPTRSAACHTTSPQVGTTSTSVGGVPPSSYERSPLSKRSRQQSRSTPFGLTLQLLYTTIEAALTNAVTATPSAGGCGLALPSMNRTGSSSMASSSGCSSSSGIAIPMSSAPSSPFVAYVTCVVSCGGSKGGQRSGGRLRVTFPAVVLPNSANDEALAGAGQRTIASFCDFATSDSRFDVDSSRFELAVSVVDREKTTGCRTKLSVESDLPLPPPIAVGSDPFADRRSKKEAGDEFSESDEGNNHNENHHDFGLDDWGGLFDDDDDVPVKRKPTRGRGGRGGRGSRGR